LFEGGVSTGCGNATTAVGPFYCPAPGDNKVYIDLEFFAELSTRFGAPGDFAQAYVIAHEVGHHVQSVTGMSDQVRQAQSENPSAKNELSVRQELQADCLAGVWAYSASQRTTAEGVAIIEPGDIMKVSERPLPSATIASRPRPA
jgi:predicted metalloprotease